MLRIDSQERGQNKNSIEGPQGGHRRLPKLARPSRKARAEKEGTPGKRSIPHLSRCVADCGKHNQSKAGGLEAPRSSLELQNRGLGASKSRPGGLKIEPRALQNRPKSPPRHHFEKTFNLRGSKGAGPLIFGGQNGQLGANSMCCARTAALQGGFEKQKVNARRGFLQQSVHRVQQSHESYAKNTCSSSVRHVPKSIKHRKNCGFVA